jgi:hypothetical protein
MRFLARLGNRGDDPSMVKTPKAPRHENILHQNKIKEKIECYCRAGADDNADGLTVPNPRGRGLSHRPPSCTVG